MFMEYYWNLLYRLKFVKRWGTSISIEPESVAEHSYYVAVAAYMLAEIDEKLNGVRIDKEKLLVSALYHDSYECYTSHIVSPIKHHTNETTLAMKMTTEDYSERMDRMLEDTCLYQISNQCDSFDEIGVYIEAADLIDAYCFCALQVHLGNKDFESKLSHMREKIHRCLTEHNFVKYFVENYFDEHGFEIVY